MKKISFLLLILICVKAKAQYVTIPDAQFAYQLSISLGCVVNGNQLDTICAANSTETSLMVMVSNIHDLTGIQYFDNLEYLFCAGNEISNLSILPNKLVYLDCAGNNITVMPPLPPSLQHFDCLGNQLTSLPNLPTGMTYLNCNFNQIITLPALPDSLEHLECGGNPLQNLPSLPAHLTYLECGGTPLTSLPNLPNSLQSIYCSGTNLTTFPNLPTSLILLQCQNTPLTSLPALPNSLRSLGLYNNQLTTLPALPNSLRTLECANNQLTTLPELPDTLNYLWCSNNPLVCLPKLKTIIYQATWLNTNITCIPNYGEVRQSFPPLSSYPLCDDSLYNSCSVFWNITGKVYYDLNTNCVNDTGDQNQVNVVLNLFNNGVLEQKTFTEKDGNYSFDISSYGTYTVRLDSSYGNIVTCPDTDIYTIDVTQADSLFSQIDFGIDVNIYNNVLDRAARATIMLYPNPATSQINIEVQTTNHQIQDISLYDISGRTVQSSTTFHSPYATVDVSNLPNGLYFLQVDMSNGQRVVRKVVKE